MENKIKTAYEHYALQVKDYKQERESYDKRIIALKSKARWHKSRLEKFRHDQDGPEYKASDKKISEYREKIAVLQRKHDAVKRPYWTDHLLPDVIAILVSATPEIEWELRERYTTQGLRAAASVWGKTAEGYTVGVTFTHHQGTLSFDTGKTEQRFAFNTIGEINGMNNITEELKTVDQLQALIAGQIQNAIEHYKRLENGNEGAE